MSKEDVNALAQAILDRFFAKGSIVNKDDWDFLVAKLSPLLSQAPVEKERVGCAYSGPKRGDCEHFVGLYQQDTDEYGKPLAWCWWCWHTYQLRLAQKEQKEGVEDAANDEFFDLLSKGKTPTPTVKEESHIQGWMEKLDREWAEDDVPRLRKYAKAFIQQIASQEYERGTRDCAQICEGMKKEIAKQSVEAGRLQGIADAVAVVPEKKSLADTLDEEGYCIFCGDHASSHDELKNICGCDFYNKALTDMLTALSSLTHKE